MLKATGALGIAGFAGCLGNGDDDVADDTADDTDDTDDTADDDERADVIRWHAGGTGGTYYPLSGELETIIEDVTNYDVQVSSTGASVENVGSLETGDADIALIQNDIAYFAYNGVALDAFEGNPVESLRGMASLYPETIHIITHPEAGVDTLEDLDGQRVNTGDLGSGTQVNALQILESVTGLTTDDFDEVNTDFAQAADQIRDQDIEAAFIVGGWPVGAVEELATTTDIELIDLDADAREAAMADAEWFAEDTIPGGTYDGVDEDTDTVSVQAMMATREDFDADVVEEVTAAIFDNADRLTIKADFIDVDTAQDGMPIPLHEGAENYFG